MITKQEIDVAGKTTAFTLTMKIGHNKVKAHALHRPIEGTYHISVTPLGLREEIIKEAKRESLKYIAQYIKNNMK